MSDAPPTIWPHDDLDEFEAAAFRATWRWMKTIEPLQPICFGFIGRRYEALGRELTAHVDAEEVARREAKRSAAHRAKFVAVRSFEEIFADIRRDADQARADALIEAGATPDDPASGW